jgi:hypothetical protein
MGSHVWACGTRVQEAALKNENIFEYVYSIHFTKPSLFFSLSILEQAFLGGVLFT